MLNTSHQNLTVLLTLQLLAIVLLASVTGAQSANAPGTATTKKAQIYVDLKGAAITKIIVINNKTGDQASKTDTAAGEQVIYVPVELENGTNFFSVNGYGDGGSVLINPSIKIIYSPQTLPGGSAQSISFDGILKETETPTYKFTILPPTNIDPAVKKYKVTRINGADSETTSAAIKRGPDDKSVATKLEVELKEGENEITVAADIAGTAVKGTFKITCTKPCKETGKIEITNPKDSTKEAPGIRSERRTKIEITPPGKMNADAKNYQVLVENTAANFRNGTIADVYRVTNEARKSEVEIELRSGLNKVTVTSVAKDTAGNLIEKYEGSAYIRCEEDCNEGDKTQGINTRAIVGFEQAGASSASTTTQPFLNFFASVPVIRRNREARYPISLWTDFRLTASSVQSFASLANISAGLLNPFFGNDSTVNNVVRSFSATGGIDFTIFPESTTLQPFFIPGKTSLSLILGAGVTTPLSPRESIQVFKVPKDMDGMVLPEFRRVFGSEFDDKENIAFVNGDRDRFFRRFFVGGRLKLNPFANDTVRLDQPSGMVDFTVGLDESITRKLSGMVFTLDAFTPIKLGKYDFIYLFAGTNLRLTRKVNDTAPSLFLEPSTSFNLTDGSTGLFEIGRSDFTRSNRDVYRFGIGIDLMRLFKKSTPQ